MLVDLNKDYLKEIGITMMGHIIAILKHVRLVYEDALIISYISLLISPAVFDSNTI